MFSIQKEAFVSAINAVNAVLGSRGAYSVVPLTWKENKLSVSCFGGEVWVEKVVDCVCSQPGSVLLDGLSLRDIAAVLPDGLVKVTPDKTKNAVIFLCGSYRTNLQEIVDSAPKHRSFTGSSVKLNYSSIQTGAGAVSRFARKDKISPYASVLLDGTDKVLKYVALDGQRLGVSSQAPVGQLKLLFRKEHLDVVLKVMVGADEIQISYNDSGAEFRAPGVTAIVPQIETVYPNYTALIPDKFTSENSFDRSELLLAVERALVASRQGDNYLAPIKMSIADKTTSIRGTGNHFDTKISIERVGDPCEFTVCGSSMVEVLKAFKAPTIKLQRGESQVLKFSSEDASDPLVLAMPLSIK